MRLTSAISDSDQIAPRHHQVYVVLRQQITEGAFAADQAMPAEHEMGRIFGVSRITIRRALERLEAEGLVSRMRGKGTFAQTVLAPPLRTNFQGIFENLLAMGLKTQVTMVSFGYVAAHGAVAAALEVPAGTVVQKAVRVRSERDAPFSHLTTYVPEAIGRSYDETDLAERPLLALLERAGVKVSGADQTISAKLADPIVAPLLQVETSAALLWVRRLVRDQDQRPVEYLDALYRPDVYEYRMAMSRVTKAKSKIWTAAASD